MSAECQVCTAPSHHAFLCNPHIAELRAHLAKLSTGPVVNGRASQGLLDDLADVALKRTRMGEGGGHRKKGDERPDPFEPDTEKSRQTPQGRASTLLTNARNYLGTIVRDMCESRGVEAPELATTVSMAAWLARNVQSISLDESAGQWWVDIDSIARQAESIVDRPTRRVWLGECPTWNEGTRKVCGVNLWAPEDAVETRCHRCKATHDPKRLRLLLFSDLERTKVTWEKILQANRSQPADRRVPERTLQSWRTGKDKKPPRLLVRGYREDGVELYLWPDVRRLRDERPQKGVTGAAARKVKA